MQTIALTMLIVLDKAHLPRTGPQTVQPNTIVLFHSPNRFCFLILTTLHHPHHFKLPLTHQLIQRRHCNGKQRWTKPNWSWKAPRGWSQEPSPEWCSLPGTPNCIFLFSWFCPPNVCNMSTMGSWQNGYLAMLCAVYSGDQCLPKRTWFHERIERVDSKAPMVCVILCSIHTCCLLSLLKVADLLKTTSGTSWLPLQTKDSSWTCSLSLSMPRIPWKLVSTLGIHCLPPPSLFLTMERYKKQSLAPPIIMNLVFSLSKHNFLTKPFSMQL